MVFSDTDTKVGHLSPWETCKAFAFHTALQAIEKILQKRSCDFLGERVNIWIGKQLQVKGGGCPSEGAVVKAMARHQGKDWYPGKAETKSGGRPQAYTMAQKRRMAEAAMSLKRHIVRPTPARVRAKLPRTCLHPDSGQPASDFTIDNIFKTMCSRHRASEYCHQYAHIHSRALFCRSCTHKSKLLHIIPSYGA